MNLSRLFKCIVLTFSIFVTNISIAEVVVNVNKGVRKAVSISISAYSPQGGLDFFISKIVENDLKSCGLFRPLDHRVFMEKLRGDGQQPNFDLWKQIRSSYLSDIGIIASGENVYISMRIYDVYAHKEIGYIYISGDRSQMRLMAHMLSNKVYERIVGEKGYFDSQILFVALTKGNYGRKIYRIALVDPDGHNLRYLTGGTYTVLTPRMSPNGHEFAYFKWNEKIVNGRRVPTSASIYLFDLNTNQTRLLRRFNGMSYAPRFSPSGTVLAFSLSHHGSSSIYTYDLITGRMCRLTKGPYIDTSPSYSPDGKYIVFNSDRSGRQRLYIMNADGSNVRPLRLSNSSYATPVWSPNGERIAFTRIGPGFSIGVCYPDGSGERSVATGRFVEGPTWLNDQTLAFSSREGWGTKIRIGDLSGLGQSLLGTKTGATDPEIVSNRSIDAIRKGLITVHKNN